MELKSGDINREVARWQRFLSLPDDGIFGKKTEAATKWYQQLHQIEETGIVTDSMFEDAVKSEAILTGNYYPPMPNFGSPSDASRKKVFGEFSWQKKNATEIVILGNWVRDSIIKVKIPQLINVPSAPTNGEIYFHKKAAHQIVGFFNEIEKEGLLHLVISWSGSFYPRFIRGRTVLSNHSWGTAFDINAPENWLGEVPAKIGQKGSLLQLVPIANKWGFFWGGHYENRKDGMHFEVGKLLPISTTNIEVDNKPEVPVKVEASSNTIKEEEEEEVQDLQKLEIKSASTESESGTVQNADNIINQGASLDSQSSDEALIEEVNRQGPVILTSPPPLDLYSKIKKLIYTIVFGGLSLPAFDKIFGYQVTDQQIDLIKYIFPIIFFGALISLLIWYIAKKVNNYYLTKLQVEKNSDVTQRDVVFQDQQKMLKEDPSIIERINYCFTGDSDHISH